MAEPYIPLEEAAAFEGLTYKGYASRISRNPDAFKIRNEPRESGKALVYVSISSLSSKARRLYQAEKKSRKLQGDDILVDAIANQQPPWYVEVDHHWYISNYREQYEKALELAELMREFNNYCGADKTGYSKEFAAQHGISQRTLYRTSENYLNASLWSLKYEKMTGGNYDYFKVLALCRKPKETNRFPSISDELKALIENIWFDRAFRANRGTIEMLYSKIEETYDHSNADYPSYQTVARYIKYLMDVQNGSSAAFLAERGTREWKNKMMMKGERDIKSLAVMGIVQGDEHTFDCWVQYTHSNGKVAAVRPKLVAWIDMRSRVIMGDIMCLDANSQIIKQSFIKLVYSFGVPEYILIDNGKDYTSKQMTGRKRSDRCTQALSFDSEMQGFYKSIGIKDDMRSIPYQPWSKAQIERFFGTVCSMFTKWFNSYTGTLTGSKTAGKVKKDIGSMLERGELLTMEEFYQMWQNWLNERYHFKEHSGLKRAGEQYAKPMELFENAENKYVKPAPPQSYAELLMMKSERVYVGNTGIRRFNQTYMCEELEPYITRHVDIKYNPDDITKIYAYTTDGRKIGEAHSIELLQVGYKISTKQLEEHKKKQNRQLRNNRDMLDYWTTPFELRPENITPDAQDATPTVVGGMDLTIGKQPQKVISLPMDKQYQQEIKENAKRKRISSADFYDKRGQDVLDRIKQLG